MRESLRKVVVTGSKGFIGRHLMEALSRRSSVEARGFDINNSLEDLAGHLKEADIVFHLAGINRPERVEEYEEGNYLFTKKICEILEEAAAIPAIVFSSTVQVEMDNPYGKSKLMAEEVLKDWSNRSGAGVAVFRHKSVFGKWCRPNYNSVVATFCHNIARKLPITISDPEKKIELIYIDEVINGYLDCLEKTPSAFEYRNVTPSFTITLGELARQIEKLGDSRRSLFLPDFSDPFLYRLYATYVSYLEENDFSYQLTIRKDTRGELAEFVKHDKFGQIFVSRTMPGITRGNHFHHTKVEKFLVVEGDAMIRFRRIDGDEILVYRVSGKDFKVIDIPPGYTHSIENVGQGELTTLFWADEVYDLKKSDTFPLDVFVADKKGTNR